MLNQWGIVMNKLLISAGALTALALTSAPAFAQAVPATENATATARIYSPLQLTKDSDLNFGTIVITGSTFTGEVVSVDQSGGVTCGGGSNLVCDSTNATAANFTVSGSIDADVRVTVPATVSLSGSNGGNLTMTPDSPSPFSLGSTGSTTFGVGGSISIDDTTTEGVYTGNFDVTAEYN